MIVLQIQNCWSFKIETGKRFAVILYIRLSGPKAPFFTKLANFE